MDRFETALDAARDPRRTRRASARVARLGFAALGLALVVALAPATAAGQSTGGSFGSSDFGGSGGSSGGSHEPSSQAGSSGGGSAEPARPPSAATFTIPSAALGASWAPVIEAPPAEAAVRDERGDRFVWICAFANPTMLFALFALSWIFGSTPEQRAARAAKRRQGPCEVRRISIAFDWTVRAPLQRALAAMAEQHAAGSEGRRRTAAELAHRLAAALDGARYACFQSFRVDKAECERRFAELGVQLRSRFQRETAGERAHAGAAPAMAARAEEGAGLVVISVVVATDAWLDALPTAIDRGAVRAALGTLARLRAPTVYGLEVVWSPSVEEDRMSSLELETFYPELQALDDAPRLGRVACAYCAAPYPAELGRCPACGAPRA